MTAGPASLLWPDGWGRHWVSLDTKLCRLSVHAQEEEEERGERITEIDLVGATFTYDLDNTTSGQFKIR